MGQPTDKSEGSRRKERMLNLSFTKPVILFNSFSFTNPILQIHSDTQCLHLPCLVMSSWHYQPESWKVLELSEQMSNGEGRMLFTEEIWKLRKREENIQQEGGWEVKKKIAVEIFVREIENRYTSMTNMTWEGNGEKDFKSFLCVVRNSPLWHFCKVCNEYMNYLSIIFDCHGITLAMTPCCVWTTKLSSF